MQKKVRASVKRCSRLFFDRFRFPQFRGISHVLLLHFSGLYGKPIGRQTGSKSMAEMLVKRMGEFPLSFLMM